VTDFSAVIGGSIAVVLRASDAKLSDVAHNLLVTRGHRSGVPRVLAVDRNEPRELAGSLFIDGSSKDNAIAQLAAINALLRDGTTLALQSRDATYAITLNVLPSAASIPQLGNIAFENDHAGWVPCRLTCEPYAYGSEQTIVSASSITAPCIVDTSAVKGDFPTPLQISLSTSGAHMHAVYIGTVTDASADIDDYLYECEDLTWSGGTASDYSSANAHDGYAEQNTAVSSGASAPLTDTTLTAATYILLGRTTQSGAGGAEYYIQTPGSDIIGSLVRATAGWVLSRFGTARLPALGYRTGGSSYHSLNFYPTAAITAYWDYVAYVPTNRGWAYYHPAAGATVESKLTLDYDGIWYDSNDRATMVSGRSGGLRAAPGDRLLIVAHDADSTTTPTLTITCTVKAKPRYALWA
jgi:hypothetical protein